MSAVPSGTVTFLFSDIEGSTRLWQEFPHAMSASLARHNAILSQAIETNHGHIFQLAGDSFAAAFSNAPACLRAALKAQLDLLHEPWGETGPVRVRMGLHTGAAEVSPDGHWVGAYTTIATAQRVMSAAHGGQTLLSQTTRDLLQPGLDEEIGFLDLGEHRLKDLRTDLRLYQLTAPALPQSFPRINSLNSYPNNLPAQLTSFIGREHEISEIKNLLSSARLVTLTGSGGTGKTRLAQEVTGQLISSFPHGIWLIELAPLSDAAQIIPALAQTIGIQELPFVTLEMLVMDYLREKKALLILDNCEHLVTSCANLANDILHHCVGIKIIASSREALGIAGEVAYSVPSMGQSESIQLFFERARAANPRFSPSESNASAIAQICQRLDGIPLAIELAAARVKLLAPEQVAKRLDDHLRLLTGGSRSAMPRQQTMRALIDWSYNLLNEVEKKLLRTASVFAGGWTLEAIEVVENHPDTDAILEQLINKSLVVANEKDSEMRYYLLESIRQYAREKLFDAHETSAVRERHFNYFDRLSEDLWNSFRSLREYSRVRDLALYEFENMHTAVEWGLDNQPELALHLAANFTIVSNWTGSHLGSVEWLNLAMERFHDLPAAIGEAGVQRQNLLAKALFARGIVAMTSGNTLPACQSLQQAITLFRSTGNKIMLGYSLEMLYVASQFSVEIDGTPYAEEGYAILSELDDLWGRSLAYMNMARVAHSRGDTQAGQKYFSLLKSKMKEAPISFMTGISCLATGESERQQGHLDNARQQFQEGLDIFRQLKQRWFANILHSEIGHTARMQGDFNEAARIYRQTIRSFQEFGNRAAIAHQLESFAMLAIHDGSAQRAALLYGAAEALRLRIDSSRTDYEEPEYDHAVTQLRSMLPTAELERIWAEGSALTIDQAIELAVA